MGFWKVIHDIAIQTNLILLFIGGLAVIVKVVVGMILLKEMKQKFNTIYRKEKYSIWATLAVTFLIITGNWWYNLFRKNEFADFTINITERKEQDWNEALVDAALFLLNVIGEIILVYFNTILINFKQNLTDLLEGREELGLLNDVSIFLRFNPSNKIYKEVLKSEEEYKSSSNQEIDDSSSLEDSFLYNSKPINKTTERYDSKFKDNYETIITEKKRVNSYAKIDATSTADNQFL